MQFNGPYRMKRCTQKFFLIWEFGKPQKEDKTQKDHLAHRIPLYLCENANKQKSKIRQIIFGGRLSLNSVSLK
jgi:hypothetical protein